MKIKNLIIIVTIIGILIVAGIFYFFKIGNQDYYLEYHYKECSDYYREFTNYIDFDLNKKIRCNSNEDCGFLGYSDDENCKIIAYNTKANATLDEINRFEGGRPESCPVYSCGNPSIGMEAKCINRKCQIVESECGLSGSYCKEEEYCNNQRHICSKINDNKLNCTSVGDNKCYKVCETDEDCEDKRCVSNIFCVTYNCEDFYEVNMCQ